MILLGFYYSCCCCSFERLSVVIGVYFLRLSSMFNVSCNYGSCGDVLPSDRIISLARVFLIEGLAFAKLCARL